MSRFKKLSHSIWHCKYHIVWVPKYRYRILTGDLKRAVYASIAKDIIYQRCELIELNIQPDHVHLLVMIPPKICVSDFVGRIKGRSAIQVFQKFKYLKGRPYWGGHFWAKGYCVDTVGVDAEMIRLYVKHQEKQEKNLELRF